MTEIELGKMFKPAGAGMEYHHIIEEGSGLSADIVQSTDNIIKIPAILHEEVTARFMRKSAEFDGKSLREWLQTQSVATRRYWGIKVLKEVGIIVGE